MRPVSTEVAAPLPAGLLARLAAGHRIALFLDYDGTISEITPDVANAQPVPGARELIAGLASRPDRFRVVIISGRQTDKLVELLGMSRNITMVGNHGLEIVEPGRKGRMAVDPDLFMPAVRRVRNWLAEIVPPAAGFVIEDKNFGVAFHYRSADPGQAQAICIRLREFVARQAPPLVIREGKMVIEAIHPQANKGAAVRTLLSAGNEHRLPVYFGDDITDEDAFYALREEGITVQVCGEPCATWARYRVASPRDVTAALAEMASPAGQDHIL